jgi:Rieske Fe-S protein
MRVRLVLVLAVVVVILAASATLVALWGGGPRREGFYSASVADLAVGRAKAITVELPHQHGKQARVFLARTSEHDVHAFLGVSTHLGCRLSLPGDGRYGDGVTQVSRHSYFEDPCGGSVYSLAGRCTGGPCPGALDHYAVELRDDHADIDLRHLVKGSPGGA